MVGIEGCVDREQILHPKIKLNISRSHFSSSSSLSILSSTWRGKEKTKKVLESQSLLLKKNFLTREKERKISGLAERNEYRSFLEKRSLRRSDDRFFALRRPRISFDKMKYAEMKG